MNIDKVLQLLSGRDGMTDALGIVYLSTEDENSCKAIMEVDSRHCQPFGFLSGGASLALAENLSGVASLALCPGKVSLGINVSANHIKAVRMGDTVTATATLVHGGTTHHVWNIDITNSKGQLISTARITNCILDPAVVDKIKDGGGKE